MYILIKLIQIKASLRLTFNKYFYLFTSVGMSQRFCSPFLSMTKTIFFLIFTF